ncbi:IclR family transcriptional regulator [Ottowia sp.]|uniref:IclR family transcriptional regulator n=1 Tax=Ottowia sp. TaxID=1898956 RepID=UPI002B802830|nr:IclR family transcriptional regulator [Ottowia sp.]HRN75168.1 IclR family transcriptional regulator [Ottowia sp.]HRQ03128.1 IclR family transcriptional regulator [Ottowia sp.]
MPRKAQTPSLADQRAAAGGAAAVDRALTLLSVFGDGDTSLSLAELAERTGLYKSTVLRLLASLEHAGFMQRQDDGRYRLGAELARLGGLYTASFSLGAVVVPMLRALVEQTGESAAFHVRERRGDEWLRLCLYRVDSPQLVRDHVRAGDVLPADRGAGGRVLQAFSEPAPGEARGSAAGRELRALIREQGYYAAIGDRTPELAGISAPVFQRDGRLAGAITLSMPSQRYSEDHVAPVVEAAHRLSGLIG